MSILIIDIGTTSMRGVLFDDQLVQTGLHRVSYQQQRLEDGAVTQSAYSFSDALEQICHGLRNSHTAVWAGLKVIGLTAQRSSVIPLDNKGEPLAPAMMWQDRRAESVCGEKLGQYGTALISICGTKPTPVFSAPKMLWIKRNRLELYEAAHKLVGIQDYLLHTLTGRFVTDASFACRSGLMDIQKKVWSERLVQWFEIDEHKLCTLLEPGACCGEVTESAARRYGLPHLLPVVTAGGDQQCAILGAGGCHCGDTVLNVGTGAYAAVIQDRPVISLDGSTALSVAVTPGNYVVEGSIPQAGPLVDRFCAEHYGERKDWYSRLAADCAKEGSAASEMLRGLAAAAAGCVRKVDAVCEDARGSLVISGGVSRSDFFCQAVCNELGRVLVRQKNQEATVQGALYQTLRGYEDHTSAEYVWNTMIQDRDMTFRP